MSTEKLNIDTVVNTSQLEKAAKQMDKMAKFAEVANVSVKRLNEQLAKTEERLRQAGTTQKKFNDSLRNTSSGSTGAQDKLAQQAGNAKNVAANLRNTNAELARTVLLEEKRAIAGERAQRVLALATTKQVQLARTVSDLRLQQEAQQIRVDRAESTYHKNSTARNQKQLSDERQLLQAIKNRTTEINKAAAASARPAKVPLTPQEKGAQKVENLFGDGGAALFKIQAGLLLNYQIMNQFINAFQFGTKFVVDFDASLKDLQATVGITNTEMEGLGKKIISVSQGTKFSAVEVAKAAVTLGQAGFSAREIGASLEGVTLLATATGSDLATSVDVASSVVTVFNLRAEDMTHIANVATTAINETKLTIDKLAQGMQYAGNIAAEAGLTFEETTAVLGAMANAGIRSGSTLGTGLRQVLIELMNPTEKLRKKLGEVGLSVEDVDIKARGFTEVMETLRDAGFSASTGFEALETRSAAAFAAIQSNPAILNNLKEAFLLTNAAAKANETQMDSLKNTTSQFAGVLGVTFVQAFEPVKVALREFLQLMTSLLKALNENKTLLPVIGTLITGLVSATALGSLSKLVSNLVKMSAVFGPMGLTGVAAFTKVAAAVTVLVGAVALLNGSFDSTKIKLDQLQAAADKAKGDSDSTDTTLGSLQEARDRLLTRSGALKGKPNELFTEMVALQTQFGQYGLELDTSVTPSVESLAGAVDKLIKKMQDLAAVQAKTKTTTQSSLLQGIAASTPGGFKSYIANDPSRDIAKQVSDFQNVDFNQSSPTQRLDFKKRLSSFRDTLFGMINKSADELKAYETDLDATSFFSKFKKEDLKSKIANVKLVAERLETVKNVVDQLQAGINIVDIDGAGEVGKNFSRTKLGASVNSVLTQGIIDLSTEKAKLRDDSTPKQRLEVEKRLMELSKALRQTILTLITNGKDEALLQLQEFIGKPVTESELEPVLAGVDAQIEAQVSANNSAFDTSAKETVDTFNHVLEAAKNALDAVKEKFAHVADKIETEIARFDAISAESVEGGGLYGRYNDQELKVFGDRQKGLKTDALKAKIAASYDVEAGLRNVIGAQGAIVSKRTQQAGVNPSDSDAIQARMAAEKDMIALQNELNSVLTERARNQDLVNAAEGRSIEANIPLREQMRGIIDDYRTRLIVESEWAYNLRTNVTGALDAGRNSMSQFFQDAVSGTKSVGSAFADMAKSIISSMLKIASDKLAAQAFGFMADIGLSIFGGLGKGRVTGGGQTYGPPAPSMYTGGSIRRAAGGADIGRDTTPILARPGEFIMRNSAVDMIGADNLSALNAMGNRRVSQATEGIPSPANENMGGSVLNVYVVSPDQKPSLSKADVLVTISEDIMRGGNTKKLIKQVVFQ